MQSKVIIQIACVVLATSVLGACDQALRDVGADMAACNLEEMKTNYPDKARSWREFEQAVAANDEQNKQALIKMLVEDKLKYVSLCMRARGWQLRAENYCLQKDADMANCYEPATASRDGIVK